MEAEISTLELLNQRDTMLCDDLRASCRIGPAAKIAAAGGGLGGGGGGAGGVGGSKPSCWALLEGVGVPKQGLSSSLPAPSGAQLRRNGKARRDSGGGGGGTGSEDDEDTGGAEGGSDSRKRVFSK